MKINREHSTIQLDNLPDEILIMILKKMSQTDVLYSLIDVNQRLNAIAHDPIFTNHLTLREFISNDSINPSTDSMFDRFCSHILPKINDKIKWLDLDSSCMERILRATNYPSLYGLTLYNMNVEISMHYATDETILSNLFQNQILSLTIHLREAEEEFYAASLNAVIFMDIINTFTNLQNLNFCPSSISNSALSFNTYILRMTSSTLLELHIRVTDFNDCLYLLDGRFSQLQELGLYIIVSIRNTFVDGNDLKNKIINKMSRLNKFHFNIRSTIALRNQINLQSNEDIQYTFKDFRDNHIISCVDYFSETRQGQSHIYSYPYTLDNYHRITNTFPGGLFKCISKISLYDERPFEHEFFLRIAQSFPLVKDLTLVNVKPQNGKETDGNQNLPIIEYAHLTTLDLIKSHFDYIEQFLLDTKTTLSRNVDLSVVYQALRKVTQKFESNATRSNCSKLSGLAIVGQHRIPKYVQKYFPHTEISIC
ncbi:unnamed protein product [Rotaria socialis]|uniref:F-box domain-containing protein n=1 Tax=Rotaria socialis TaxID=392032 RepID=A0A821AQR6_9BILA|nr:unnamed protein product [Rotaria socialis]